MNQSGQPEVESTEGQPSPHVVHDSQISEPGVGVVDHVIPIKNPLALLSYYFGVFALIPLMGAFFGLASVPMGIIGLKRVRESPSLPGTAHAWVGIVLGTISVLAHLAGLLLLMGALARAKALSR